MAPRKKARPASRVTSTPPADASDQLASATASPQKVNTTEESHIIDAWTDEQETSLLQSIIRWKPVGMHKHFRMIAISENLRNNSYTSPTDEHTRPAGIWKKLGSLYNLEALDQIEDGSGSSISDVTQEPFVDFDLPEEDYWEMTFARRLAPAGTSSPPALPFQTAGTPASHTGRRHSTVDDSEDLRSSPASTKGQRGGRGGRSSRPSKLAESSRPGRGGRGTRGSVESHEGGGEDNDDSMDMGEETGKTRRSGRRR